MATNKCPECGSENIAHNGEGLICEKCGLIISEPMYSGQKMLI